MNEPKNKKRGFAAMDAEQLRRIASAGGVARREAYKLARQNGKRMAGGPSRPAGTPSPISPTPEHSANFSDPENS